MAAGSIVWELLMKTASFETDSKKAEKRIKELKKESEALGAALGTAVVAGAAAMTYAIKSSIDSMDELSKSAQKVGTTTEALSALQYAASLADVSNEELALSMAKLAKNAADGNDAFAAMGVKITDSAGNLKDTSQLMSELAGKFASYKDGAEKTALAQELFGRGGARLIPLLNSGADGLKDMADEASRLGLIVSGDTGKAAEEFNDTLTRIKAVVAGVTNQMASELLPVLQAVADYLLQGSKESGALAAGMTALKTVFQAVTVLASDVAFTFKMVGGEIGVLVAQAAALARGDLKAAKFIGADWTADAAAARKELDAFQAKVLGVSGATAIASEAIGSQGAKIAAPIVKAAKVGKEAKEKLSSEAKAAIAEMKRLMEEGQRLAESLYTPREKRDVSISNINKLSDVGAITGETQQRALIEAEKTYQDYVTSQRQMLRDGLLSEEDEIKDSYERRRQMILALTEATETEKANAIAMLSEKQDAEIAAKRLARYRDLMSEEEALTADYQTRKKQLVDDETISEAARNEYLTALAEKYHDRMRELDEADAKRREELSRQQVELVSQGFAGAAEIAKAFQGEQSATYKAMFAASKAFAIADMTIKQSQAIAKAWGENNYWVAAGLTVSLAAQFASLIGSANSANFGGTRADGGSVIAGRTYLVGERGPEMFTAPSNGQIVPNSAMRGGDSNTNIYLTVPQGSAPEIRRAGGAAAREIGRAVSASRRYA